MPSAAPSVPEQQMARPVTVQITMVSKNTPVMLMSPCFTGSSVSAQAAVMAAAVMAGGCISAPGMSRCFYVLLPYAAEVGLTGSVVWAMTRWQAREYPMREYVYKATVRALPGRCLAEAVLAGAGIIAETVYLILSGSGGRGAMAAVYLLLKAVSLAAALFARYLVRQSVWEHAGKNGEMATE